MITPERICGFVSAGETVNYDFKASGSQSSLAIAIVPLATMKNRVRAIDCNKAPEFTSSLTQLRRQVPAWHAVAILVHIEQSWDVVGCFLVQSEIIKQSATSLAQRRVVYCIRGTYLTRESSARVW